MNTVLLAIISIVLLGIGVAALVSSRAEGSDDELDRYLREQRRAERAREKSLNAHASDGSCLSPEEGANVHSADDLCLFPEEGANVHSADDLCLFPEEGANAHGSDDRCLFPEEGTNRPRKITEAVAMTKAAAVTKATAITRTAYSTGTARTAKAGNTGTEPGRVQSALDQGTTRWSSRDTTEKKKGGSAAILLTLAAVLVGFMTSLISSGALDEPDSYVGDVPQPGIVFWDEDDYDLDLVRIREEWDGSVDPEQDTAAAICDENCYESGSLWQRCTYLRWDGEYPESPELQLSYNDEDNPVYLWQLEQFNDGEDEEEERLFYRRTWDPDGSSLEQTYEEGQLVECRALDPLGCCIYEEYLSDEQTVYTLLYDMGDLMTGELRQDDVLLRTETYEEGELASYDIFVWEGERVSPDYYSVRYHYTFDDDHELQTGDVCSCNADGVIPDSFRSLEKELEAYTVECGEDGFAYNVILLEQY